MFPSLISTLYTASSVVIKTNLPSFTTSPPVPTPNTTAATTDAFAPSAITSSSVAHNNLVHTSDVLLGLDPHTCYPTPPHSAFLPNKGQNYDHSQETNDSNTADNNNNITSIPTSTNDHNNDNDNNSKDSNISNNSTTYTYTLPIELSSQIHVNKLEELDIKMLDPSLCLGY